MLVLIEEDIGKLQVAQKAQLTDLQAKQKSLQHFIYDHNLILSPFRRVRLPPEVWTEIFRYTEPVVGTNTKEGIWQLGHVCSYWRSVLISSPSLWSRMQLLSQGSTRHLASVVEEMLIRSNNALLDITLGTPAVDMKDVEQATTTVLRMMTTVSHRWYIARFGSIYQSQVPLLSNIKGRIPVLTELHYAGFTFPDWLVEAPSLRRLYINGILWKNRDLTLYNIPFSQLSECDFGQLTVLQAFELLHLCPNLEEYTLDLSEGSDLPDMARMSKLHTLTVRYCEQISDLKLMDRLILPCLDSVVHRYFFDDIFISCFVKLLLRSSCTLLKLKLAHCNHIATTVRLLSSDPLQNLTTLDASCKLAVFSSLIACLTIQSDTASSSVMLPQLENLHLSPDSFVSQDVVTSIIDMTRSRWHLDEERAKTIRRLVFFQFAAPVESAAVRGALAPLRAFAKQGLKIAIDRFYLGPDADSGVALVS